ncbi:helix-turn-helix domain-containing protein [Chryseobacterium sp. MIQD13]|uniref:helix-turn-helix domain-containing protein n=1 Tax=Chryseobacterium sp. MIQD13 TaxID=3422310 RepID=UPI003D2CF06F
MYFLKNILTTIIFFMSFFLYAQSKESIDKELKYIKESGRSIDPRQQEVMLLKLKAASEKLAYEKGILLSGDYLMTAYGKQDKNKEIVELGNQLKKRVQNKKKDPTGVISSIYHKNALALVYLGLDDTSKKDTEMAIRFAKTIDNPDRKYFRLTQSYMDLHSHYNNRDNQSSKKIYKDSTLYYLNQALEAAKSIRDNNGEIPNNMKYAEIIYVHMRLGIFYLEYSDEKGNLELAEKNLLKAEKINENNKGSLSAREESTLINQLSWLYMEKKEYHKSIDYANHALQLEKQDHRPTSRVESYEFLATCYMEIGEKEKSKFYMRKYTNLKDSLNIVNRLNADTTMKKMIIEVDKGHKENLKEQLIIIGILVVIAAITIFFLWRRKNKIIHKKYKSLIAKINTEKEQKIILTESQEDIESDDIKSSAHITDETAKALLLKLEKFEAGNKYLRKDINLVWLTNSFNTNTKYLSEIIKIYRNKSFTQYINSLRINFIIHKLISDPQYRQYKISYLADECGYASSQVFVISFKKETGFTPSYFIQNLKNDASIK